MRGFGGGIEWVGLLRREVLESTLRFDESLSTSSGLDFTLKLCQLGQIAFDKKIGLLYQISEGQWHSNSDELKRNMEIIRQKYSNFSGYDLNEWHLAYIYWSEIKTFLIYLNLIPSNIVLNNGLNEIYIPVNNEIANKLREL
jgi:hypothetical protein